MRILHVANFSIKKYAKVFYATDKKISNGFIRNGDFVYEFSDRDIARMESIVRSKSLGRKALNSALLKTVENLQPDFLLLGHTDLLEEATLDRARRINPELKIAQWFVDPLFEPHVREHLFQRLPHLDAFFCTTAGDWLDPFRKINSSCYYLPNPVDDSIETLKNDQRNDFPCDLIYCGIDHKDPVRTRILAELRQRLTNINFCLHGSLGTKPIFGAAYLNALANSKMGLSLSRRSDIPYYSSDRIAQLAGNGLLVFIPETPGFRNLFSDEEVVYFSTTEDLFDRVTYYQKNDGIRKAIACAGRKKAHASYSTQRIARFISEATSKTPFSEAYEWT
ncbi:MAG: glycosyltransferase [Candidatus Sedimenticola endophacoides]